MSLPWFGPYLAGTENEAVAKVIASNYINDGQVTRDFEKKIAAAIGAKYAVGVTSGTVAISLALIASGVSAEDEVIVPDLTFIATANAVSLFGAKVKLVDTLPGRMTIDPEKIKAVINNRTKAIVTVDVNGRGCEYPEILAIAKQYGLKVICDSAEALGSKYQGQYLGTYGDAGCFSFSANKTISTGQGGMVVTNDEKIHARLLELKDQGRRGQGTGGNDIHYALGFNFKLTNLQSAIGLCQLETLPSRLDFLKWRDDCYENLASAKLKACFPKRAPGEILQWRDMLSDQRDKILPTLKDRSFGYREFWYPLHTQAAYKLNTTFPYAEKSSNQGFWLPSYFTLKEQNITDVVSCLEKLI